MKERHKVCLSVYLVLFHKKQILLSLRQNTGYEDNKWSLVAGHVECGETAKEALCREAKEEIGIIISPKDLEIIHVMHRLTNRENIDIFMGCTKWQGTIQNCEPEKCGGIKFFPRNDLPENIIQFMKDTLALTTQNVFYSEYGWELQNTEIAKAEIASL